MSRQSAPAYAPAEDIYAEHRCVNCPHLIYADHRPGEPCLFGTEGCTCTDHVVADRGSEVANGRTA